MAKQEPHAGFTKANEWHQDGETGCIYKHGTPLNHVCDYAKNGYDDVANKKYNGKSIYNLSYQQRAKLLGYIEGSSVNDQKIQQNIDAKAGQYTGDKTKSPEWKKKWKGRLSRPFELLAKDAQAWDIEYKYKSIVKPWWGGKAKTPPDINYKPKRYGGWDYRYPLKHNWHHMIAKGEFYDVVIFGPKPENDSEDKCTPLRRAQVVIHKNMIGWNINNKKNIILLPNEEPHALVMKLPSHCPWSLPNHNNYINTIKKDLERIRKKIDDAIMKGTPDKDHIKDVKIAKDTITDAEENIFEKLMEMTDINQ